MVLCPDADVVEVKLHVVGGLDPVISGLPRIAADRFHARAPVESGVEARSHASGSNLHGG
jgi:hypothetical protein